MLHGLGITALRGGDIDTAVRFLDQSLEQSGCRRESRRSCVGHHSSGLAALYQKSWRLARTRLVDGLRLRQKVEIVRQVESLEYLAYVNIEEGRSSDGAVLLGAAARCREHYRIRIAPVESSTIGPGWRRVSTEMSSTQRGQRAGRGASIKRLLGALTVRRQNECRPAPAGPPVELTPAPNASMNLTSPPKTTAGEIR